MNSKFYKISLKLCFLLLFILPMTIFSSCGDDNDEPTPNPTTVTLTEYSAVYSVNLSQPWFDFFDIEVEYNYGDGNTVKEIITENKSYRSTVNGNPDSEFEFKVTANPKSTQPNVTPNESYKLEKKTLFSVVGSFSDGHKETIAGSNSEVTSSQTLRDNGMENYIKASHKICDYSQTYK